MLSLARRQLKACSSPADFAELVSNDQRPWHIEKLNRALLAVARGEIKRLAVSMPPRHGKSRQISQHFPAWFLGMYPDKKIILTSYEADFAATWGRKSRDLLNEHGDLFGVSVRADSSAANRWDIVGREGGMVTAGVGGPITGKGADILIIDDPVKNAEDARSDAKREKAWDWYLSTAYTRLEPGGAVILVMTRWHEDDLAGRLLRASENDLELLGDEEWTVVDFPAIAIEDDEHRKAGEALWPERYPLERLERIRRRLSSYWWSALYQQRPAPPDGTIFKREGIRWYREDGDAWELMQANQSISRRAKSECLRFQTVDLAVSEKESADWTVVSTWDLTAKGELIWVDMVRQRVEGADHIGLLKRLYEQYHPSFVGIEDAQFQLAVVKHAAAANLPARRLKAKGDKYGRALSAGAKWENGLIYMPANGSWCETAIDEMIAFNNGAHDDIVDTVAYAAIEAAGHEGGIGSIYGVVTCAQCTYKFVGGKACPKCGSGEVEGA